MAMLVGAMALAAIAGCGGSDDESLTKVEFIKQGDALCKKIGTKQRTEYNKAAAQYLAEGKRPSRARGVELAEQFVIPGRQAQVEGLEALSPPSDEAEQVSAMLQTAERGVAEAENDPASIFLPATSPFTEPNKELQGYGFKVCGSI
jgi:hypothetical protein